MGETDKAVWDRLEKHSDKIGDNKEQIALLTQALSQMEDIQKQQALDIEALTKAVTNMANALATRGSVVDKLITPKGLLLVGMVLSFTAAMFNVTWNPADATRGATEIITGVTTP